MTKEEFVELHGEEVWRELVRPMQEGREVLALGRGHGNCLADDFIGRICAFVNTVGWPQPKDRDLAEAWTYSSSICGDEAWTDFYESAKLLYFKTKGVYVPPRVLAGVIPF